METLKPKLRFPEFEGNWETKQLGEIFSIFNGYAFSSSDSIENGVLWVKIADVGVQQMKKDNLSFLPIEYKEKHKKFILKKDDYVIALTRPILNGKLKIAKIDDFFNDSLLNQRVGKLITSNNSTFIFNILQRDLLIKSIENNISGSDPPNLSPNEISYIESYIPSLKEQTRIANFLSSVDEKLNLLKEKKALLEEYKKGIMQKIFNQDIRFKDDNGNDYEEWGEKRFNSVLKSIPTKKHQIQSSDISEEGKYPVIDQGKKMVAGFSDSVNNLFNDYPVIVFGDHTTILKYINFDFIVGADGTKLLKNISNDNLKYLYYNLIYNNVEQEGYKRHFSILSEISLQIPSKNEQTKIANFLSAIDKKIELVSNQIQDTQEYKKGLLQQMFV